MLLIMSEKVVEELREHVAQLKEELQEEKNKFKRAQHEKASMKTGAN